MLVQILVISGYSGLTRANIIFRLKNLYWSGTEKSRLLDLNKRKKKIAYRSNISNILIYFPSHCCREYVAEVDPISPSSLLLRPHTAIPNASFFCSISFVFSNSFYLSFLILCAESAHTRLIKKFYFIFTFIVLCVLVSDPCEHRIKLNSLFLFLHFHYFPLSSTMRKKRKEKKRKELYIYIYILNEI